MIIIWLYLSALLGSYFVNYGLLVFYWCPKESNKSFILCFEHIEVLIQSFFLCEEHFVDKDGGVLLFIISFIICIIEPIKVNQLISDLVLCLFV